MNPKVNFYFAKSAVWHHELGALRQLVLDCGLQEELKWGVPCYVFQQKNIVLLHVFKAYCAILFFKGALLKDSNNILVQQTENVQAARQARFTNIQEIIKLAPLLKAYIYEAIEVEKAGLKVEMKKSTELIYPDEFKAKIKADLILKNAFEALTPGRQRAYILYFSAAKQAKTRNDRIEKCVPNILNGKGLSD
jgi:uncharacterized protein YdeI (YjbR/CyaY-like superfamily)